MELQRSLFEWLMRQRYLIGNPWVGVRRQKISQPKLDTGRSFTAKQWAFLKRQLT